MNEDTKRIDTLLTEWARWGKDELVQLGYPVETLDSKVARFGFTGAAQGSGPLQWPEHIEWVERAVLRIQQIERTVLVEEYMNPWMPRGTHARRRHMSETRYGKLLERARKSVRSQLLSIIPSGVTHIRVQELIGEVANAARQGGADLARCA